MLCPPARIDGRANAGDAPLPQLGLYCHVPFCAPACDYCAFYQTQPRAGDFELFVENIGHELALNPPNSPAATFFWGGGTPGLLPPELLTSLGTLFLEANGWRKPVEWTVEMTPGTVRPERLAALRSLGVTRISVGVQSFDPDTLAALGRRHTQRQVFQAMEWLGEAGFPDISLDLIFAVPGQDEARWRMDLEQAVRFCPQHISTYCLTLEEDTALYIRLAAAGAGKGKKGNGLAASSEREAALYRTSWNFLEEQGYAQYEISNFSRPGHSCLHNRNTWRMGEWLGYGPAAASQLGFRRWRNPPDLVRWRRGIERAALEAERVDVVELTPESLLADALIFGLRMNEGVSPIALAERFGCVLPAALGALVHRLHEEGFLDDTAVSEQGDGFLRLTLEGRLRADAIAAAILCCFE
ncbi:MAG: coproporphyrinogen III oxidase family protein [Puniceicoccales bacterium]|nr:coproporphyrinogen III oxidase family protein [Puniceicoccales bacterium]